MRVNPFEGKPGYVAEVMGPTAAAMEKESKRAAAMEEYYKSNKDFRGYVDRYAKHNSISPDEALTHAIVKQVYLNYLEITEEKT